MPGLPSLSLFAAAALVLLLTPGPAVLYIVARSLNQGRRAGLVSALGIGAANLVHAGAASVGIAALLVASALAFNSLKYLGAAYLIYLGVRKLLSREEAAEPVAVEPVRLSKILSQGFLVNLLNPKPALFFLAFLPQFIDPSRGSPAVQTLALGLVFVALAVLTDSLYAILAGTLGRRLTHSYRLQRAQHFVTGGVYIGLGVATALAGSGKK